jgi:hypothetical protein
MNFEIRPFGLTHTPQVLGLSLRAWTPVFAELEPAVPDYV